MTSGCIFCSIINRTQDADIVYEDNDVICFKDIKPAAKTHVLIVPKIHIKDPKSLKPEDKALAEKLIITGNNFCESHGLEPNDTLTGFHWPPCNSVKHLHMHLIHPKSEMSFASRLIFKPGTAWFVTPEYVIEHLEKNQQSCNIM